MVLARAVLGASRGLGLVGATPHPFPDPATGGRSLGGGEGAVTMAARWRATQTKGLVMMHRNGNRDQAQQTAFAARGARSHHCNHRRHPGRILDGPQGICTHLKTTATSRAAVTSGGKALLQQQV